MGNTLTPLTVETQNAPLRGRDTENLPLPRDAERLASLDAFRGFIMLWIIGGEGLMAGLAVLGHNRVIDAVVYELSHSPWQGLRFYDCIWPSFMLMVGVSVPLSFAKRSLTQTYYQQVVHAIKRAIVLFLLGSVRESVLLGSPYLIELSSALQPIAIAYLVLSSYHSCRLQAYRPVAMSTITIWSTGLILPCSARLTGTVGLMRRKAGGPS